jgi:hypothetical protein
MYSSYIFFMSDYGKIKPVPREEYVALVRGEVAMPEYAEKRIRVADFYVAVKGASPKEIENETYSFLTFDKAGYANAHHGGFSMEENRDFYRAALNSPYADIDCDSEIQKVRERIGDEFSWLPTDEEKKKMHAVIFDGGLSPE